MNTILRLPLLLPLILVLLSHSGFIDTARNGFTLERNTEQELVEKGVGLGEADSRLLELGAAYVIGFVVCLLYAQMGSTLVLSNYYYWILLLYVLLSMGWSVAPLKVVVGVAHYIGFIFVAAASAIYFYRKPVGLVIFLALFFGVMNSISVILTFIDLPGTVSEIHDNRWQGITSNPNTLGVQCMLGVWAGFVWLISTKSWFGRLFATTFITLGIFGVFGSGSATSMICSGVAVIAYLFMMSIRKNSPNLKLIKSIVTFSLVFLILSLSYIFMPEVFEPEELSGALGKDSTLTGRTDLWALALRVFEIKPLIGWSFDALASIVDKFPMDYGQFHNGYLDILVRGGLIGLLGFLIVYFGQLFRLFQVSKLNYSAACAWLSIMLAAMIQNLTEASFLRSTSLIWCVVVLGLIQYNSMKVDFEEDKKKPKVKPKRRIKAG